MRLVILSFFAVLLGYSLLFDQREETKPKVDSQEVTTSSNVMAPRDSDSIAYSYVNWLSITPSFHSLGEKKRIFMYMK